MSKVAMIIKEEDRIMEEALRVMGDIDKELKNSYRCGDITLEDYKALDIALDMIYISYGKLQSTSNRLMIKAFIKLKGMGNSGENIYIELLLGLKRLYSCVRERQFLLLKRTIEKKLKDKLEVRCFFCDRKESYSGKGFIIRSEEELPEAKRPIGRWVCSQCSSQRRRISKAL